MRFLIANMIYTDGLIALFAFGGIYAAGTFGWTAVELGVFGILLTITGTAGSTIKYTTDGSNPKTSSTASTYSAAVAIAANTKFRAYQSKSGSVNSPIATYDAVRT